jgi:plastocyanin
MKISNGMNKKIIVYIVIALVIILAIFYFISISKNSGIQTNQAQIPISETPFASSNSISIANFSFNPQVLSINKGDAVVWTNQDSVSHQITGENFNSPIINNGQSYSFIFDAIGTYNYHCAIHPSMTGTIIVQ